MSDAEPTSDPIASRDAKIARLEARIVELEAIIERLTRGGKRQAAPFSKRPPLAFPKKPGRKAGEGYGTPPAFRAMPEPAEGDQVFDVPAPEACPACNSSESAEEETDTQVHRDIEVRTVVRRFVARVVKCVKCGAVRRGRHALQTSSAAGCCASQVGPTARAAMAYLNKSLGLSLGKIADAFSALWGLSVTPGGVSHAIQSIGRRCREDYKSIVEKVRKASHVTCDETGWRVGGVGHWLHAAATPDACAYLIDKARGSEATDRLIGEDFAGTLVHDGWAPYDRYTHADHQQCLAHLLRRCKDMIEVATRGSAAFPAEIKATLKKALELRDERDARKRTPTSTRGWATRLTSRVLSLCGHAKRNPVNERLAAFLYRHAHHLFTFLRKEGVDATNWRGEHAMRAAVVNRKVWGGNRTAAGAETQSILTSVLRTLKLRGVQAIDWLRRKLIDQPRPSLV